jgi:azurin
MSKRLVLIAALCLCSSPAVFAKSCPLTIEGNDQMQYSTHELKIDADCTEVSLTLTHTGKLPKNTMGHGWVLTKTTDMGAVAKDGVTAGLANNFIKPGDARVIAHTKIVAGGDSDTITFSTAKMEKGGDYSFFCPFPGHFVNMKGKFVFG